MTNMCDRSSVVNKLIFSGVYDNFYKPRFSVLFIWLLTVLLSLSALHVLQWDVRLGFERRPLLGAYTNVLCAYVDSGCSWFCIACIINNIIIWIQGDDFVWFFLLFWHGFWIIWWVTGVNFFTKILFSTSLATVWVALKSHKYLQRLSEMLTLYLTQWCPFPQENTKHYGDF